MFDGTLLLDAAHINMGIPKIDHNHRTQSYNASNKSSQNNILTKIDRKQTKINRNKIPPWDGQVGHLNVGLRALKPRA